MPTYLYRPSHPEANENGMVEKSLALEFDYLTEVDNRAMIGNQVVTMNFISDHMADTRHMANNKMYSSKHEFRKATKAAGCIEVGNDKSVMNPKPRKLIELDRRQRRDDIRKSIYEAKNVKKV